MNEIKKRRTAARYCLLRCDDSEKSSSIWQRWRWLYNKTERATFFFLSSSENCSRASLLYFFSTSPTPPPLSPFPSPPYFSSQRRITRLNYFLRKYRETWSGSLCIMHYSSIEIGKNVILWTRSGEHFHCYIYERLSITIDFILFVLILQQKQMIYYFLWFFWHFSLKLTYHIIVYICIYVCRIFFPLIIYNLHSCLEI